MEEERIILVDENDNELGSIPKLEAHQKGLLHRAFSVFIFNEKHEMLIHQRALGKYHSGGLWTNACCSHPKWGEKMELAVKRRLAQEMGIACSTTLVFHFRYKATFENNLFEHELDHVFVGKWNGDPTPDPQEVCAYRWITMRDLRMELQENPERFTFWFKEIMTTYSDKLLGDGLFND